MAFRLAVLAALAALIGSAAETTPAKFSPWYIESLRGVHGLSETDAATLERQLAVHPDDQSTRLKLMAYYQRGDRASRPKDRAKRAKHTLWLIEHHPESEILHAPCARFSTGELSDADLGRATQLFAAASKTNTAVQWNAASFFENLDSARYLHYLESTVAADPNHPFALRPLAYLYALAILERGPLAQQAQAGLNASKNVWVLGNAAYMLQSQYNQSLQSPAPNPRAHELAEKYFLRAQAIDPKLDRMVILPRLDLTAVARAHEADRAAQRDGQRQADEAVGKIRRLAPRALGNLPASIIKLLEDRNCKVPQPDGASNPRNVIRGEFIAKGVAGWAALCSVNNSTTLFVFRNDNDTNPQILGASDDRNYLQGLDGDQMGYSREITTVGRDFIIGHYRAYGGSEPPPIDHHAIDDAFVGKASVTLYFHNGKWLRLQGAD